MIYFNVWVTINTPKNYFLVVDFKAYPEIFNDTFSTFAFVFKVEVHIRVEFSYLIEFIFSKE